MLFSIIHNVLIKLKKKQELTYFIAIPLYILLMNISWFHYYSALIIGFDLYILNQIIKNKEKNKLKNITNEFTKLASNYFDYVKEKQTTNTVVKDYTQKKINITDTLQHTIETIKN